MTGSGWLVCGAHGFFLAVSHLSIDVAVNAVCTGWGKDKRKPCPPGLLDLLVVLQLGILVGALMYPGQAAWPGVVALVLVAGSCARTIHAAIFESWWFKQRAGDPKPPPARERTSHERSLLHVFVAFIVLVVGFAAVNFRLVGRDAYKPPDDPREARPASREAAPPPPRPLQRHEALYHSAITALTIGYGDIYPTTPSGRLSAGVEGLLAFFYAVIAVARFSGEMGRKREKGARCSACGKPYPGCSVCGQSKSEQPAA